MGNENLNEVKIALACAISTVAKIVSCLVTAQKYFQTSDGQNQTIANE